MALKFIHCKEDHVFCGESCPQWSRKWFYSQFMRHVGSFSTLFDSTITEYCPLYFITKNVSIFHDILCLSPFVCFFIWISAKCFVHLLQSITIMTHIRVMGFMGRRIVGKLWSGKRGREVERRSREQTANTKFCRSRKWGIRDLHQSYTNSGSSCPIILESNWMTPI